MGPPFTLPVEPLSAEAFAPYGWLLAPEGPRDAGREGYDIWIKPFAAEGAPRLQIVRYHARPLVVGMIERHLHVTEARLPLPGPPAIIVVASPDLAAPAPQDLRAFRLDGTGVIFRRGTWHAIDAYPERGGHADFLFLSEEATVNELFATPKEPAVRIETIDIAARGAQVAIALPVDIAR
ncbi:ureidoglycolate lyase [Bosea sp. BK604]|uniref:ureidoglycolate lyase n=1 Tax=Bosea sp. BK604 TaxID=2512180 RepID=UPI00104C3255|nr:ureidoglycolate lyase [Bosea sp. BK604]TCR61123.1 ureidoglycolate hydrolase [Bosea sp. BK604]